MAKTETELIRAELENVQHKTGITRATGQAALATLAIACITLGLNLAATEVWSGAGLMLVGVIIFIVDFYFGGQQ